MSTKSETRSSALFRLVTGFGAVFLAEGLGGQRMLSPPGLPEKQALSKGSSVSNSFVGGDPWKHRKGVGRRVGAGRQLVRGGGSNEITGVGQHLTCLGVNVTVILPGGGVERGQGFLCQLPGVLED